MAVLVDSNVILDVATNDPTWGSWSAEALARAADESVLVINPIVVAEISVGFDRIEDLEHALPPEFDGPEDTLSDFERFIDGLATYPETGVSLGQLSTRRTGPGGAIPKSLNHFRAASLGSVTCQIAPLGVNN